MRKSRRQTPIASSGRRESRRRSKRGRAALDPALQDQFDRGEIVVHAEPTSVPRADALQWPHYEPKKESG
jgi:hypothetical protein